MNYRKLFNMIVLKYNLMKLFDLAIGLSGVLSIALLLFFAINNSNNITGHVVSVCPVFSVDSDSGFFVKGSSVVSGCSPASVSDFCLNPCVVGEYVGSSLIHVNCSFGCVDGACLQSASNPSLMQYCADRVGGQELEICDNRIDDDGDGKIDCADVIDCADAPNCINLPIANCSDGIKNQDETDVDCGGYFCLGCLGSGKSYYVSNSGSDSNSGLSEQSPIKTIAKVNSLGLMQGDNVLFKADNKFTDAILVAKKGVTYASYGRGKGIIGDANLDGFSNTIKIDQEDVTIDNLKIYGYKNGWETIEYTKGGLTISNCEIIGGYRFYTRWLKAIYSEVSGITKKNSFISNKIHDAMYAIHIEQPYNVEIGYNEIFDIYKFAGRSSVGGIATIFGSYTVDTTKDSFDTNYTLHIHHNDIYNFEHSAIGTGGVSRALVEYNHVHHNLDERLYQGGVTNGIFGKVVDFDGHTTGSVGNIFRYNYVHDIGKYGEPGHIYARPTLEQFEAGQIQEIYLSNGEKYPCYNGNKDYPCYINAGDDAGNPIKTAPYANLFGGGGYSNYWIHNNIIQDIRGVVFAKAGMCVNPDEGLLDLCTNSSWSPPPERMDLGSYWISNTLINVGNNFNNKDYGVIWVDPGSQAPYTVANNIIDYQVKFPTITAARYDEYHGWSDYNIYTTRNGSKPRDWVYTYNYDVATWWRWNNGNTATGAHEYYLTDPNWNNPSGKIFAPNIGPKGVYIPDVRLVPGGNAHNKGYDYDLIGDTYKDVRGQHELGKDFTGRSLAYDILGDYRTTNDVGAVGVK